MVMDKDNRKRIASIGKEVRADTIGTNGADPNGSGRKIPVLLTSYNGHRTSRGKNSEKLGKAPVPPVFYNMSATQSASPLLLWNARIVAEGELLKSRRSR